MADDVQVTGLPAFTDPPAPADAGRLSGTANLSITDSVLDAADIDPSRSPVFDLRAGLQLNFDTASLERDTGTLPENCHRRRARLSSRMVGRSRRGGLARLGATVPTLALRLRGNQWPIDQIYADWPADIAREARVELMRRATGGRLENFELEISGGFQRSNAKLEIVRLDLRSAVRGVLVNVGARQYEQLSGKADGNITLSLGRGGSVEACRFPPASATARSRSLRTRRLSPNRFRSARRWQTEDGSADVTNLRMAAVLASGDPFLDPNGPSPAPSSGLPRARWKSDGFMQYGPNG